MKLLQKINHESYQESNEWIDIIKLIGHSRLGNKLRKNSYRHYEDALCKEMLFSTHWYTPEKNTDEPTILTKEEFNEFLKTLEY